ncbi:hypothetical protein QN224_13220 [Sinorhizobium sp. 8-89]|uniref:hypothetical protein n=1 Tax=Sinorhizobium sp. 7-81 TaxID=3049087 RepID=UPI0024C431B6|nr:hypothetical protein [Sinorhizobium sp. 7-81]MDK1386370.1 hypothetical protein [Sinorhizobium sp. 7-81]
MTVRFAVLEPAAIFNLTSPRYLPEIAMRWRGRRYWHDGFYEPLRDLMEETYVDGFNGASGHYDRLLESLSREGFRNPVIVSAGSLQRRAVWEVPPQWRGPQLIACEYLGGSRLWAAQKLGLGVPCIVNDFAGVLAQAELLRTKADVLAKFQDRPGTVRFSGSGVYINGLPFMHLPPAERYGMRGQCAIRRQVVHEVTVRVHEWLEANDQ